MQGVFDPEHGKNLIVSWRHLCVTPKRFSQREKLLSAPLQVNDRKERVNIGIGGVERRDKANAAVIPAQKAESGCFKRGDGLLRQLDEDFVGFNGVAQFYRRDSGKALGQTARRPIRAIGVSQPEAVREIGFKLR